MVVRREEGVLKAHSYKVKSEVIIDNKGGTFELFFKVW
jgi:hypothetical protein